MTSPRSLPRLACAALLGLAAAAACASAAPDAAAQLAHASPLEAGPDGGPRCPYGALQDPHRGFVRCLQPDERDAGWLPPPPQGEAPPEPPSDAGAAPPPDPPSPPSPGGPLPAVEIGAPKFENGEVTKVEKSLGKAGPALARCVADHGGLTGDVASVKIQFLVRARGRAEGVEVLSAKNVGAEAAGCVRQTVKNRAIGAPTSDPVGVTVVLTFRGSK